MRRLLAFFALFALSTGLAAADTLPPQLVAAFETFGNAKSYHMSVSDHGKQVEMDFVKPDRFHMTMSGGQMEIIKISDDTYMKMGGSWRKFSVPGMDKMMQSTTQFSAYSAHREDIKVTDLGTATVDGTPTHEYGIANSKTPDDVTDVYIASDNTVRKMTTKSGGVILITNYNGAISIDPPAM